MSEQPVLDNVYLFVRDMPAALAFYRRLGLDIDEIRDDFARAEMANGLKLEFGTADLTRSYDPNWREPTGPATNTLNFAFASREAVDAMYAELMDAGYVGQLPPWDAFWGARCAIVNDPDGNIVAIHSPEDPARRHSPPQS